MDCATEGFSATTRLIIAVIVSFLIEVIDKGSTYMSSQQSMESEIAAVITGLILLFSACSAYFAEISVNRRKMAAKSAEEER